MKPLTEEQIAEQMRRNAKFQKQDQPRQVAGEGALDVRKYLDHYGIPVIKEKPHGGSTLYVLRTCIFDESHNGGEAAIGQTFEGKLFYKCFHNSCKGRTWHDARQVISGNEHLGQFMPGYKEPRNASSMASKREENPKLTVPDRQALRITSGELSGAKLNPRCIVQDFLYADVAVLSAPGGTGKTTLTIYEAIHIVLGRRLYGLDVVNPGWCLFATAEDSRELLIARLREVTGRLGLTDEEMQRIRESVLFWDVSGAAVKLIELENGNIILTELADGIVEAYKNDPPAMILFDPIVSFGVGESRINDNEQGLIMAARRIRNGLGCVVRVVAHTGQAAAREKSLDQYTSRGGTALPDGSRMSYVLQSWTPKDQAHRPPRGCTPDPGSSIMILARPKLSYSKPNPPLIWIKRTGWTFEHYTEVSISEEEKDRARLAQVERFLESQESLGHFPSKKSLEGNAKSMGLNRQELRDALAQLIAEGRIIEKDLPKDRCQGARKTYLSAQPKKRRDSARYPKNTKMMSPDKPIDSISPPLRKKIGGDIAPPDLSSVPRTRRESSARFGEIGEINQKTDRWEREI
jgi:RecA-family ATPase